MAKTVVISVEGTPVVLENVEHIKTDLPVSGHVVWIPIDEIPTQTKTATPSGVEQVITPGEGFLLSSVTVEAIPVTRVLNEAGGYTVTIGVA